MDAYAEKKQLKIKAEIVKKKQTEIYEKEWMGFNLVIEPISIKKHRKKTCRKHKALIVFYELYFLVKWNIDTNEAWKNFWTLW